MSNTYTILPVTCLADAELAQKSKKNTQLKVAAADSGSECDLGSPWALAKELAIMILGPPGKM